MRVRSSFFLILFPFFLSPIFAEGAYLYLDPSNPTVYRGDTVTLSLRLDTGEGECINAIDAVINYGEGVRAVDVSRGDSILNIWLEEPKIDEEKKTIHFAGGITGGYCGRAVGDPNLTNVIADIVFQSPGFAIGGSSAETGVPVIITDESSVLLNDGFGTESVLTSDGAMITLTETPSSTRTDTWHAKIVDDTIPPSDFSVTLAQEETAFGGNFFIVWNALDKQSGIDHYEIMEEPLEDFYAFTWGRADAPWVTGESPYVLKDQTLNSTIRVKAIDKAGNETISVFLPDKALRSISIDRFVSLFVIGVIALISICIITYALVIRRRRIEAAYESHD